MVEVRVRPGLPASIAVHAAFLLWGLLWFPATRPLEAPQVDAIPIDIVPIGTVSQAAQGTKTAALKPKPAPEKVAPKSLVPDAKNVGSSQDDQEAPPKPTPAKTPAKAAEDAPPPPPPPPPTPSKTTDVAKVEPPKPPAPPKPEKAPAKAEAQDPAALSKLVEKETADQAPKADTKTVKAADKAPTPPPPPPPTRPKPPSKTTDVASLDAAQKALDSLPQTTSSVAGQAKAKPKFDTDKISALLNKVQPSGGGAKASTQEASLGTDTTQVSAALLQSQADALRRQIRQCWTPPLGATGAVDLKVRVHFGLNPDGTLSGEPQVLQVPNNAFGQVAGEAAVRALKGCGPYTVFTQDTYDQFRDNTIDFDPMNMF